MVYPTATTSPEQITPESVQRIKTWPYQHQLTLINNSLTSAETCHSVFVQHILMVGYPLRYTCTITSWLYILLEIALLQLHWLSCISFRDIKYHVPQDCVQQLHWLSCIILNIMSLTASFQRSILHCTSSVLHKCCTRWHIIRIQQYRICYLLQLEDRHLLWFCWLIGHRWTI